MLNNMDKSLLWMESSNNTAWESMKVYLSELEKIMENGIKDEKDYVLAEMAVTVVVGHLGLGTAQAIALQISCGNYDDVAIDDDVEDGVEDGV